MAIEDLLAAVQSDRIRFATMRPPGSRYATLDRRVVVVEPPELVELSRTGDPRVLDELVDLLADRDRAWAAEVLLATMTRREEKLVESFATAPDEWWQAFGATARERWRAWLREAAGRLAWNPDQGYFVEGTPADAPPETG
jgi:hypothetical protein